MWIAFAALVLGYVQAPVAAMLFVGAIGSLSNFNQELNRNPEDRAALAAVLKNGGRIENKPAEDPALSPPRAVAALRMIRDRQTEYRNAHTDGYACRLEQIGEPFNPDNELGALITKSHYQISMEGCGINPAWYTVLATSKTNFLSLPVYCLNSSGGIYRYRADPTQEVLGRLVGVNPEVCPQSGEIVVEAGGDGTLQ